MHDGLQALADEFWDGSMARSPFAANAYGDHRFDDRVPDLGPDGLAEHRAFVADVAARAEAMNGRMTAAEQVTHALLVQSCRTTIEALDSREIELQSDGFTALPVFLLRGASRRTAPDADSAERQLTQLEQLPVVFEQVASHWRTGAARGWTPSSTVVGRAKAMVDGYLATPATEDPFVHLTLPEGWNQTERWRDDAVAVVEDVVRPAYRRVSDTLGALRTIGRTDDRAGLCNIPGGDELYASLVRRSTTTELTPDVIHRFGMDEVTERLPGEWAAIGQRALGISDQGELFRRLRSDPAMKYDDAAQILRLATDAIRRAMQVAPSWFERLPTAGVVVEEVPENLAPGSPPAYYGAPPADGSKPGVYFANTFEPTRRNCFEAEVFAFHEAVPGHHLERASAVDLDVPMFQRFSFYMAHGEGWGLYAERLADEMGLYSSDLMRLGMLSADAWRSARLVLDTGLHAEGWTRAQAIEFMVTHVPIAADEAAVEVDRYIGMPGQALSYKIGQRELFRLRDDARERLGPRFDVAGFHTAVLEHGGVPLGLLAHLVDRWVEGRLGAAASTP